MGKTLSDLELDFFEFDDQGQEIEWRSDDDTEEEEIDMAETKAFWESQHQLLQVITFILSNFLFSPQF